MRIPIILAVATVLQPSPGLSEILYARPDAEIAGAQYRWGNDVVPDAMPLKAALAIARSVNGTRALEIRLLHASGARETLYSVDLGSLQTAPRWQGSENAKLVIRGQLEGSAAQRRALTTVVGRSLTDTICDLDGKNFCAETREQERPSAGEAREGMLDNLTEEMDRSASQQQSAPQAQSAQRDVRFRLNCFLLWESAFVEFAEMGFRECWFAAVSSYASSNIALRDSIVEGSTWAFLAVGKKARPETAHSFEVTGNVWRQSPSTYRHSFVPCEIQRDWGCPVSIWSDLPWGIVHHHFWSPLNGALFMSRDVLGNVRISNNYVFDAYNGVRGTLSDACRADADCKEKTNNGFEITGNFFEFIRDNAVEPEDHAAFWIVKHNAFVNSYAAISTDGVSGNDLLVFGNVFALQEIPGSNCRDDGWLGSRKFLARRGVGRWSTETAEADDASCVSHRMGTVIKLGGNDRDPDSPLLRSILFFNNSVRTRSPLFRASLAPPILSYNNAVSFIGCGTEGAMPCRQLPIPDPPCAGKDFWTVDGGALFADCFPLQDAKGNALPHRMRFNAYDRAPAPKLGEIDKDRVSAPIAFAGSLALGQWDRPAVERMFRPDKTSLLAAGGCSLEYAAGELTCVGRGGLVGAILPNGSWYDLQLPFGYPFAAVLQRAAEK